MQVMSKIILAYHEKYVHITSPKLQDKWLQQARAKWLELLDINPLSALTLVKIGPEFQPRIVWNSSRTPGGFQVNSTGIMVIVKNSSPPPTVGRQITNSLPTGFQQVANSGQKYSREKILY